MTINKETLIQTEDVRVRVMNLQPGEATPLHHHSEITDHMVGLTGKMQVKLKDPSEELGLGPGERCQVESGRVHQVRNINTEKPASYLLIQGVGRYDFKS